MTMMIAVIIMVMVMTMTKKMQDEWLQLLYDYETFNGLLMTLLKGQCHKICCFRFFFMNLLNPSP